jgi:chemotaxis protein MotB
MRKFTTVLSASVLIIGMSTSCVSKKKYVQAQTRISNLQQDSTALQQNVDALKADIERMMTKYDNYKQMSESEKAALMSQLDEQSTELSQKDQALQLRAERLRALQERLQRQQEIVNNLRKTVEDALVNFNAEDLSVEVKNGKVYVSLSDKLLFPSGSAQINKEGEQAISKLAEVLNANPKINIDVVGHTDTVPINTTRFPDNWELSTARATSITRLLTDKYNVPGTRLTASGGSKYSPVASNATKEGRARNRRTEIILTPKLEELFKILEGSADTNQSDANQ